MSACGGKQTTSESLFRKSFTSFDTYFVFLEQLASLSDKRSTLKEFEPSKYYL